VRALTAVTDEPEVRDGDAEVLVIDNASTTPVTIQGELAKLVTVIEEPVPGLTAARDMAIRTAVGDVIVFVDDDNIIGAGYLGQVRKRFAAHDELGLLGGAIYPEYETVPPSWFTAFEPIMAVRRYPSDYWKLTTGPPFTNDFPIGAGMSVRRSIAVEYARTLTEPDRIEGRRGGALSSGEDVDLGFYVLARGGHLAVDGRLRLRHVIPAARLDQSYLRKLVRGTTQSALLVDRKWSPAFGAPVMPPLHVSSRGLFARAVVAKLIGTARPAFCLRAEYYEAVRRGQRP